MSDFPPIDTAGLTDRDLMEAIAKGMNATHNCLDGFRQDQAKENADARRKRHALANSVSGLQGAVTGLSATVGKLETAQEVDSGRIDKLAKLFGAEKVRPGEKKPKGTTLASMNRWQVVGIVFGSLSGAVMLVQIAAQPLARFFVDMFASIMAHQ